MQPAAIKRGAAGIAALAIVSAGPVAARAETLVLKKGTEVHLLFDTPLHSATARIGDVARFHAEEPVTVDDKVVIKAGEKCIGTVRKVTKRGRFGANARIQLDMSGIRAVNGSMIPLGFHTKGNVVGSRTGEAAGATLGGAAVLGPVGLIGGYFVVGKKVNVKVGDKITVTTDEDEKIAVRK